MGKQAEGEQGTNAEEEKTSNSSDHYLRMCSQVLIIANEKFHSADSVFGGSWLIGVTLFSDDASYYMPLAGSSRSLLVVCILIISSPCPLSE